MQTLNGPGVDGNTSPVNSTNDARHASNVGDPLTESQAEFWYLIECQGCKELAHSLKMIHDLALYHSDIPFDRTNGGEGLEIKGTVGDSPFLFYIDAQQFRLGEIVKSTK
jgi:hypothetical protein